MKRTRRGRRGIAVLSALCLICFTAAGGESGNSNPENPDLPWENGEASWTESHPDPEDRMVPGDTEPAEEKAPEEEPLPENETVGEEQTFSEMGNPEGLSLPSEFAVESTEQQGMSEPGPEGEEDLGEPDLDAEPAEQPGMSGSGMEQEDHPATVPEEAVPEGQDEGLSAEIVEEAEKSGSEPAGEATDGLTKEPEAEQTGEPEAEPAEEPGAEQPGESETAESAEPEQTDGTGAEQTETPEPEQTGEPEAELPAEPEAEQAGELDTRQTETPASEQTGEPEAEQTGEPEAEKTEEPQPEAMEEPAEEPYTLEAERDGRKLLLSAEAGVIAAGEELGITWETDSDFSKEAEKILQDEGISRESVFRHWIFQISGTDISGSVQVTVENAGLKELEKQNPGAEIRAYLLQKKQSPEKLPIREEREWDRIRFTIRETGAYDLVILISGNAGEEKVQEIPENSRQEEMAAPAGMEADSTDAEKKVPGSAAPTEKETALEPMIPAVEEITPWPTEMPAFSQSRTVNGVRVTVSAPEGAFPAGAVLSVSVPGGAELEQADAAMREKLPDERQIASAYFFDIKIISPEGEELQPEDGRTVTVAFALEEAEDPNLRADVYHMTETEDGELDAQGLAVSESGGTVEADSPGFSIYTLVLSYDLRQFDLLPGVDTLVSEVLNTVGLEGEPIAVSLKDVGLPPQLSLMGDQIANWTLTSSQSGDARPVLTATIRQTEYQVQLHIEGAPQQTAEIRYLDEDGDSQIWKGGYASASAGTWRAGNGYTGWWVVDQDMTVQQRINVKGDVCLILCDDCTLTAAGGIQVSPGNSLTIYGQEKGNGTLNAASRQAAGTQTATGAAIGGAYQADGWGDAGLIRIFGGTVTATAGAEDCAGIGGGTAGSARIEIARGTVDAAGNGEGPGIGGEKEDTVVEITGGDVTAKAGRGDGAGITGLYGEEIVYRNGKMIKGDTSAPKKTNTGEVIYAPDGTVYTGTSSGSTSGPGSAGSSAYVVISPDARENYTIAETSPGTIYYAALEGLDASGTEEDTDVEAEATDGPGSEGPTVVYTGSGSGGTDGGGSSGDSGSYNALLVLFSPEQENEMAMYAERAIIFENHRVGSEPEQAADILQLGLDGLDGEDLQSIWNAPGAPRTAEELIASFGYMEGLKADTSIPGPMGSAQAEPDDSVDAALEWLRENRVALERLSVPFFMNVHAENGPAESSPQPGNASGNEPLSVLLAGLEQEGQLDRTVLICTVEGKSAEETVPMMIVHPAWPEGAVVKDETSHLDVLPTILELNGASEEREQSILQALPGRDLLSMVDGPDPRE